jgi:hypothetical protein
MEVKVFLIHANLTPGVDNLIFLLQIKYDYLSTAALIRQYSLDFRIRMAVTLL